MTDGQRLPPGRQRGSGLHRRRRDQTVTLAGNPQAGLAQCGQGATQIGAFQQLQALAQRAFGGRSAFDQALAQRAQFLAGMRRTHHIQGQETFQGATEVLREVTTELLEYRWLHRMRPVITAHEARRGGDHSQTTHLRQRGRRVQREQAAQ